jgi:hypothetical protein
MRRLSDGASYTSDIGLEAPAKNRTVTVQEHWLQEDELTEVSTDNRKGDAR